MQDNNNGNSIMTNGSPVSERFANIRAAEERKLLARNHANNSKKMMDQLTKIPIPEDENEDVEKNSGHESGGTASTPVDADNTDSVLLNRNSEKSQSNHHPRRYLEALLARFEVSQKSRRPFLILSVLCFLLLLIVIVLAIVWPYIPSYMRSHVCIEPECFDASKQIVGWADLKESVCDEPYKFMCSNFINQYKNHELYLVNKGEWSAASHFEYENINAVNAFVSKLPNLPSRSSIQPMIKKIYTNCMNIRSEERTTENLQILKTILESARGWNIFEQSSSSHQWSLKENLPIVQVNYGVWPLFKVSIEDGNITLSEGELGLPDEQLYFLHRDHPIIIAYKELIRDVYNSLKSSTNSEVENFVDNLFGFERRIVNAMRTAKQKHSVSQIKRLYDVQTRAHSLPIDTSIQNMFSNYRVDDDTPIRVKDLELIHQISVVATATEPKILNDFVMWTLVRHFIPLMSHRIRSSLDNFNKKLYGNQFTNLPWHFCTQLTQDWMRFGIEALRQNPQLIVVDSSKLAKRDEFEEELYYEGIVERDQLNYNDEFVKILFFHIRDSFRFAIYEAPWIDSKFSDYVNHRLSSIRLQIGIPQKILRDHQYVQQYYREFIINDINFMKNIEQHWSIEKKILANLLKGNTSEEDRIVYEMFSSTRAGDSRRVKYLKDLNMVIVDREILREPYYHYKYPLAVNFGRLGVDLAGILLEAAFEIGESYKEMLFQENQFLAEEKDILHKNTLEGEALKCINNLYSIDNRTFSTPGAVRKGLFSSISVSKVIHRALTSFLTKVEKDSGSIDAGLVKDLNINKRQNGLMKYGPEELLSMTLMQRHCSVISDEYKIVKVFTEGRLPEREMFDLLWQNVPVISKSFECSTDAKSCSNIL